MRVKVICVEAGSLAGVAFAPFAATSAVNSASSCVTRDWRAGMDADDDAGAIICGDVVADAA
jgi:hypothetical protein